MFQTESRAVVRINRVNVRGFRETDSRWELENLQQSRSTTSFPLWDVFSARQEQRKQTDMFITTVMLKYGWERIV